MGKLFHNVAAASAIADPPRSPRPLIRDPALASVVLRAFVGVASGWLRHRVRAYGIRGTLKTGGVTVIQRFGSALNLNVPFHTLMIDGVYEARSTGAILRPPSARGDGPLQAARGRAAPAVEQLVQLLNGKPGNASRLPLSAAVSGEARKLLSAPLRSSRSREASEGHHASGGRKQGVGSGIGRVGIVDWL